MRPRQDGSELSDGDEGDVGHEINLSCCHNVPHCLNVQGQIVWVPNCPSDDDDDDLCQKSREDEPIESVEEFKFRTPWL